LSRRIKEQLAGRPILDEQDLIKEIMVIRTGLSGDEKSRVFNHSIERCESIENNADEDHPSLKHFG
jgi:hypothetical protein